MIKCMFPLFASLGLVFLVGAAPPFQGGFGCDTKCTEGPGGGGIEGVIFDNTGVYWEFEDNCGALILNSDNPVGGTPFNTKPNRLRETFEGRNNCPVLAVPGASPAEAWCHGGSRFTKMLNCGVDCRNTTEHE